jgi:hypothetical protein
LNPDPLELHAAYYIDWRRQDAKGTFGQLVTAFHGSASAEEVVASLSLTTEDDQRPTRPNLDRRLANSHATI